MLQINNIYFSHNILTNNVKLYVLLYADNTILSSETREGNQKTLESLYDYIHKLKLAVNSKKTKVAFFFVEGWLQKMYSGRWLVRMRWGPKNDSC